MTNYIHRLQDENAAKDRQIEETREGIALLRSYLMSSKFHDDTTVQVSDVLMRLAEIESAAQVAHDTKPEATDGRVVEDLVTGRRILVGEY